MNDKCSNSDPSTSQVISKYFIKKDAQMDDSISEFQETKKKIRGPPQPKPKPKTKKTTGKPTKKPSKGKGQKDIRSALKSKKIELESYSKEFKKVCLESGIDIDSEQLQIAVALSKSIHDFENSSQASSSQSQNNEDNQDRNSKIRTTLLEYGFSVPEIKVSKSAPKTRARCIRQRRNIKLFNTTEEERKQKIADKIAQVLFDFSNAVDSSSTTKTEKISLLKNKSTIFYETCGQTFEHLKNDDCFYVGELVERLPNMMGCLLKDWSKIPGRAVSPPPILVKEKYFTEFVTNQCDLDVLLSGTLDVVRTLLTTLKGEHINDKGNETALCVNVSHEEVKLESDGVNSNVIETKGKTMYIDTDERSECTKRNAHAVTENALLTAPTTSRSYSPDLFDDYDELSKTTEISCHKSEDFCTNSETQNLVLGCVKESLNLSSQNSDKTKRISNNIMDITECVISTSNLDNIEVEIDLTQYQNEKASNLENNNFRDASNSIPENNKMGDQDEETLDLTQSSESNDSLPYVHLSSNKDTSQLDITSSIDYNYPKPDKSPHKKKKVISVDESVYILNEPGLSKPTEILAHNHPIVIESIDNNESYITIAHDLSQTKKSTENIHSKMELITNVNAVFDEFSFHHSSTSACNTSNDLISLDIANHSDVSNEIGSDDKIDLTQSSYDTDDKNILIDLKQNIGDIITDDVPCNTSYNNIEYCVVDDAIPFTNKSIDNGGKTSRGNDTSLPIELDTGRFIENEGNISVIYDVEDNENIINFIDNDNKKQVNLEIPDEENICGTQCSNAFEISDEELDYSMQYFKAAKKNISVEHSPKLNTLDNHNFNVQESSIMTCVTPSSSIETPNKIFQKRNTSFNHSFPAVEIKGTKVRIKSPQQKKTFSIKPLTPIPKETVHKIVTPSSSEYILKTTDVTPMLDYTTLDTPQRNKELEKYGIKPFKRKRAVQLLQHIYYQTHPLVEDCNVDMETPKKRPKLHSEPTSNSESKTTVLNTASNSTEINGPDIITQEKDETLEDRKIYEECYVKPVVKDLPCDVEDLIFQRKEKAKIHGCRVPLHIAFHNYVSGRPLLREAILRYEPVSIDIVHKQMAKDGYRYDAKDLLKFMDKKCITVKTMENNSRNGKSKKS